MQWFYKIKTCHNKLLYHISRSDTVTGEGAIMSQSIQFVTAQMNVGQYNFDKILLSACLSGNRF